jgi:ribonuclease R
MGERTRRTFRLGDPVRVKVVKVNLDEAKLDFELAGDGGRESPRAERGERHGKGPRRKRAARKK